MNKSESIKNIGAALVKFHENVGKIKKNASNPFFKSSYADLPNILESIHEPLRAAGLIFTQFPGDGLTTILIHPESGEWIESEYKITPVKSDPQAVGSAITYARRYALSAILGLSVEDDDGNQASGKVNATKAPQPERPELKPLPDDGPKYEGAVSWLAKQPDRGAALESLKKKYYVSTITETQLVRDANKLVTSKN